MRSKKTVQKWDDEAQRVSLYSRQLLRLRPLSLIFNTMIAFEQLLQSPSSTPITPSYSSNVIIFSGETDVNGRNLSSVTPYRHYQPTTSQHFKRQHRPFPLYGLDYTTHASAFGEEQNSTFTFDDGSGARNSTSSATGFPRWWALSAFVLVIGTAAGNVLVCLAISWERRLQNVTNYFLASLAITDLMVAILVMPMGILALVEGK